MILSYLEGLFQQDTMWASQRSQEDQFQQKFLIETALEKFQRMEVIHDRLADKGRRPASDLLRTSFSVLAFTGTILSTGFPFWFSRGAYLVQGVTLDGWGWYGWSSVTHQMGQVSRQPFAELQATWKTTPLPWLMQVEDPDFFPFAADADVTVEGIVQSVLREG